MSYTDAEKLMATQVAYLDFSGNGLNSNTNVGDVVDAILNRYGTYDSSTGTYTMKEGVDGAAKAQFENAQNILNLSEQNNTVSWRQWTIVDSCDKSDTSGFYGCLIDTGNGDAIVGCRGSESYDAGQTIRDWVVADVGRVNNPLTWQQADATEYTKYLYEKYGDNYDSYTFTGHSLGGSLATHSAITAPEGMQDKIEDVTSFDGPGYSDEYLRWHADQIEKIRDKLNHYEWSWVGGLLNQPDGINNRVIKAHDDEIDDGVWNSQMVRHHTRNVEFDKDGNVIDGERGVLQQLMGPITRFFENTPIVSQGDLLLPFLASLLAAYLVSIGDQVFQRFEDLVQDIAEKVNDLYHDFLALMVSGDYEVHTGEICSMADELESVQNRLDQIADEIDTIRRDLPYDSYSAFYYKNCLWKVSSAVTSEGKKAKKLAKAADKAVSKYNKGDQKVSAMFV